MARYTTHRHRLTAVAVSVLTLIALAACQPSAQAGGAGSGGKKPPKAPAATTTTTVPPSTTSTTVAPTTSTTMAPTTTTTAPTGGGTWPGGIWVDESKIPAPSGWGVSTPRIGPTDNQPHYSDGIGAFRTDCRPSHMSFDDPIVFPGKSRATHLHAYFGNTAANASSTPTSIRTSGSSTCSGGTLNRSAYWAPAVIDTRTGAPVSPGTTQHDQDYALQIYYKTGYDGVRPESVRAFPEGLRMIAGTGSSRAPQPGIIEYSCTASDGTRSQIGTAFPSCPAGSLFIFSIEFPQCWDGVNLDSPDHKSHMAYGLGWYFKGCPASHPVPLTQITQHYRYRVPAGGMSTWRLSSDMYDGPAGYSGHADWMNGWDTPTFQRIVTNCYHRGLDCELDLLGDGYALKR